MSEIYTKNAHSVCRLTYHAVFVVKYRRKVISPEILDFMEGYSKYLIEEKYRGRLIKFNGEEDHVHILFELPPAASPSVTVCNLKTQLSKLVRKNFSEEIRDKLWNGTFWSDSYFLTTTGGVSIDVMKQYIEQQGVIRPKRKYVKKKKVAPN